jgi:PAB-dependent poly(A)-specific ribonuclease subunit 2
MAFGDSDGTIHLITADEGGSLPLNGFDGQPVEWADTPEPLLDIEWSNSTYIAPLFSLFIADLWISGL